VTQSTTTDSASDLHNAFLLGATISELQGRIRSGATDTSLGQARTTSDQSERTAFIPYVEADSDVAWVTSIWRVLFERLSLLHNAFFPESDTDNTRYDPGVGVPRYLFPDPPNYADVGIAPDPSDKSILTNFKLREVTRRGINCLALLVLNPAISLLPDILETEQRRLVAAIDAALAASTSTPPSTPAGGDSGARSSTPEAAIPSEAGPGADTSEVATPTPTRPATTVVDGRDRAISTVTRVLLTYLHAWEGYLRESFYAAGIGPERQNQLIAFEAGLSLTWLSWGLTVATSDDTPSLQQLWSDTFNDAAVSRLQHQVGVIATALDDARNVAGAPPESPVVEAGDAVKRSLDYWQRAVSWLSRRPDPSAPPTTGARNDDVRAPDAAQWDSLRQALIEQTSIWQALVLEQEALSTFSAEAVTQQVLQDVAATFQNLVTRRGLFGAAAAVGDSVTQATDIAATRVAQVGNKALGALVASFWPVLLVLLIVLVVGVGVAVQHGLTGANPSLLTDLLTPLAAAVGAGVLVVRQQTTFNQAATSARSAAPTSPVTTGGPSSSDGSNSSGANAATSAGSGGGTSSEWSDVAGRVESITATAVSDILHDFERGYAQAQHDLQWLGRSIGVSYPLVEFFVLEESWKSIQADIQFMDSVVWNDTDRRQEIVRVASAAFGALGAFAMAAATNQTTDQTDKGAPEARTS
jgi:hypothetical protein